VPGENKGGECRIYVTATNMEAQESPVAATLKVAVPSNKMVDVEGAEALVTFPSGYNFSYANTPEFPDNPRIHVYTSRPMKTHFLDITSDDKNLTNVPEVQTVTITDTYKSQHIDFLSDLDLTNDIDEVQVITLTEHFNKQTIEVVYPISANLTERGTFKIAYGSSTSSCMPWEHTSIKFLVEAAIQTIPQIQKVEVVDHYHEIIDGFEYTRLS
jgi:hypothetical protein